MTSSAHNTNTDRLSDQREIIDCIYRYCRGIDRRDYDLARSTMHPDCQDNHGDYEGGVDGLIEWTARRHLNLAQCMHCIMNCLVEFVGPDTAVVESYFVRMRVDQGAEGAGGVVSQAWARYVDVFERRSGEWKISQRKVVWEALVDQPAQLLARPGLWQKRDKGDPLYAAQQFARERAGLASKEL
ncbi:MAG: nuclear transport factor 2 family protein [Ramlibacter sp.]